MGFVAQSRYRLWQFWRDITAVPLSETAWSEIQALLSPAEQRLFRQFSTSEQQHSYRVFCLLRQAGYRQPALLKAALLHDIGKTRLPLTVWDRVFIVLSSLVPKSWRREWASQPAVGWRKAFAIREYHPEWGAQMVTAVGTDALTVALIRRHQDNLPLDRIKSAEDQLLHTLQWADDRC